MRPYAHLITYFAAGALLLISGCGGSDSSSSDVPDPTPPPVGQTSEFLDTGPVTSVVNNTLRVGSNQYSLSGTAISINGESGTATQLHQGMIVSVTGSRSSSQSGGISSADSVDFDSDLEGAVSSIDTPNRRFVVLGVQVQTDNMTVFEDVSFETLAVGNIVEVSGFRDENDVLLATFVELKAQAFGPGIELEIQGIVNSLNENEQTFMIGSQLIDYSQAQLRDLPNNRLSNDILVEAKSTFGLVNQVFIASEVEGKGFDDDDFDEFEVEGIVTRFESITDFSVGPIDVTTTTSTRYENGSANDVSLGTRLKVKGALNNDTVLVADEISFRQESDIEIEASLSSVDTSAGTVTTLGLTVHITDTTQLRDSSDLDVEPLTLDQLNNSDFVEIDAFISNGQIIAHKLERDDPEDEVSLQGAIDSVSSPNLVIMGISIVTTSSTEFEDLQDNPISADTFFGSVQSGDLVKVKGQFDGNVILAEEVEFED